MYHHTLIAYLSYPAVTNLCVSLGHLSQSLKQCKDNLKHYYLNRMDRSRSTKWPQLGDPEFYLDVTITTAKYSYRMKKEDVSLIMERYCEEYAMGLVDNKDDDIAIEKILLDGKRKVSWIW